MEEYDNRYKWSQAAAKGLILAGACIALTALTYLSSSVLLNSVLQIGRTFLCVWLLVRFMQEYSRTTGQEPLSFGLATVLLSSLICAFFEAASYAWLFPELKTIVEAAFDEAIAQVPESGRYILEDMLDGMPKWMLIVGFIKDYLIGLFTALIVNSSLKGRQTIFDGTEKEEEEDELA